MDTMNDLKDLLKHDVRQLQSVEEQIIEALPAMIEKAQNPRLKQALQQHLDVTRTQRDRLDDVEQLLGGNNETDGGVFSGLFETGVKSKGMAGLIDDGQKILALDMNPAVKDAAIICAAQKIEHVEIAGYGTAKTYAEQLGLTDVAQLLQRSLLEEHDADDLLTTLAEGSVNQNAEAGVNTAANTYR